MTTDPASATGRGDHAPTADRPRRRRPAQAQAGRILATGAALTATGILVAVMGTSAAPAAVQLTPQAPPAASAPPTPTTIVVIHRPAATSPVAPTAAPAPGRVVAAPRPARTPTPVATSTAS